MASVKLADLLIFTNQFASMMRSQLPLVDVLVNLARETPQKDLRACIEEISEDVENGVDFGDALAAHPDLFDDVFVNIVKAGMMSGRLADSLTQISEYLDKADTISRKVRGALSYPLFMLVAFAGVFNAMVFFILPRFEAMFASFDRELPVATRVFLAIGGFWREHWYLLLGGAALLVIAMLSWLATHEGRYLWDQHKMRLPVVGRLWRMAALSRFLRTFSIQLHNEVELLASLELAATTSNNVFIEESLHLIAEEVERGVSITGSFEKYEVFDGIVLQMIAAGEEAGTLDELLMSAADFFERLLDNQVQVVTGLINPVLTVFMGASIAAMMVASFLPVFDMGSAVH